MYFNVLDSIIVYFALTKNDEPKIVGLHLTIFLVAKSSIQQDIVSVSVSLWDLQ